MHDASQGKAVSTQHSSKAVAVAHSSAVVLYQQPVKVSTYRVHSTHAFGYLFVCICYCEVNTDDLKRTTSLKFISSFKLKGGLEH